MWDKDLLEKYNYTEHVVKCVWSGASKGLWLVPYYSLDALQNKKQNKVMKLKF